MMKYDRKVYIFQSVIVNNSIQIEFLDNLFKNIVNWKILLDLLRTIVINGNYRCNNRQLKNNVGDVCFRFA